MENVKWATPIFSKANATIVRNEIVSIANGNEYQSVKPQEIVDYAQLHPESELHKCFEWDDTKAANSWRKQQARLIVCNLVVEVDTGDSNKPTVARTMLVTESGTSQAYKPVEFLQADEYTRLLNRAWTEAKAWAKRYKSLKDSGIQAIIEMIG